MADNSTFELAIDDEDDDGEADPVREEAFDSSINLEPNNPVDGNEETLNDSGPVDGNAFVNQDKQNNLDPDLMDDFNGSTDTSKP